jgi:hypothetical protein
MTAIVLDHESRTKTRAGTASGRQASSPDQALPASEARADQRPGRDDKLDYAAHWTRSAMAGQDLCQVADVARDRDQKDFSCSSSPISSH